MTVRKSHLRFASTLAVALVIAWLAGADDSSKEYKVKAAFIYNFAQFVDWPETAFATPDAPFVVAVVGKDPFNGLLDRAVGGKIVGNRRAIVQQIDSIDKIIPCQILFIPQTDDDSLTQILKKIQGQSILTIGENENLPSLGGCCRFFTEDDRVRFEINLDAVNAANLKISSKLLKLARIYQK
jgi:hypothetical protein